MVAITIGSLAVASFAAAGAEATNRGTVAAFMGPVGAFMMPRGFATAGDLSGNWTKYAFGSRMGFGRSVEVSEEFKTNVLKIANADSDVQKLLGDGYSVTGVMPIITRKVDGSGNIVTKATGAVVTLQKGTTGRASAWVDLEKAKVTRVVITTRTVIEKP